MGDKRVEAFKKCGPSAQRVLLENGCWANFNAWMRSAITSKDVPLIKEILQIILTMPTSYSMLKGSGGPFTLTIEKLMKCLALRKTRQLIEPEMEQVLKLCAAVFARWLRMKKGKLDEISGPESGAWMEIVTETGEKGDLVPVDCTPGIGLLAVNRRVSLVEIQVTYPTPPNTPPIPTSSEIKGNASEDLKEIMSNLEVNFNVNEIRGATGGETGARNIHRYANDEEHQKPGCVKEKLKSRKRPFGDLEEHIHEKAAENIPWKLLKIQLPPRRYPLKVDIEAAGRFERQLQLSGAKVNPLTRFSPCRSIPTHDITNRILKKQNTWVYDYSQRTWPKPKKSAEEIDQ